MTFQVGRVFRQLGPSIFSNVEGSPRGFGFGFSPGSRTPRAAANGPMGAWRLGVSCSRGTPERSRRWAAAPGAFPRTPRTRAATACPPPRSRALHASPACEERRLRRRLLGEWATLFERGAAREAVGTEWPTAPPCRCRTARPPERAAFASLLAGQGLQSPSGGMAQNQLCVLSDRKRRQVVSHELPRGQGGRGTEAQ